MCYHMHMAKGNTSSEHAFIRIEKDLKAGSIPGLVLLCGNEDYLTEHYKDVLIRRFVDPATRQMDFVSLSGSEITAQALEENAETISLLSERRVVLLSGIVDRRGRFPSSIEPNKGSAEAGSQTGNTRQYKALVDYFGRIPEGVLVILTADKPVTTGDYKKQSDGRKLDKLKTAVKKAGGKVYEFTPLDQNQIRGFISKRFIAAGKTCSPSVLRHIVNDTGYGNKYVEYDLFALENDLRKIIAHCGSKPVITEEDLRSTLTVNPENNIFRMLDAISLGRKDQALIHLNNMLEEGENEFGILARVIRHLENLVSARELADEGRGRQAVYQYLTKERHMGDYPATNAISTASRLSTEKLRHMLLSALQVDEHVKSGLMDGRLALEYFIAEV